MSIKRWDKVNDRKNLPYSLWLKEAYTFPAVSWNCETNLIATDFLLMYLSEKYDYVGRLLKPGEEPSEYTDEEDTKDHNKQDWTL